VAFTEITNATDYEDDLTPSEVKKPVKIVHHGVALVNRKIEVMIEAVLKSTIACELHLILVPTEKEYFEKLVSKYASNKRIIFSETVAVKQISKHLNQFDIGLFYLEPVNYNWKHALPNKLFEFVQARLAVIISPNPDMKKMVEQYELGWVTKDFSLDSLVETINSVTEKKIEAFKRNSQKYSKELSSIKTKQLMLESVDQLCAA
jgi:glycosyltransferase involved in cell wall biosynthesis